MKAYSVRLTTVPLLTYVLVRSRVQADRLAAVTRDSEVQLVDVTEDQAQILRRWEHEAWVERHIKSIIGD